MAYLSQPASLIGQLKGIVSRDLGALFLIYLEMYEVPNRARSCLFFILLAFSDLNFHKDDIRGKEQFRTTSPGIVTVRRIFLTF
jgi:hypothetical protein